MKQKLKKYIIYLISWISVCFILGMGLGMLKDRYSIYEQTFISASIYISVFIILAMVLYNHCHHLYYIKKMKKVAKMLDENKVDEYIEEITGLLKKVKGNYLKTLFTLNLSVGYADKKDYVKGLELLESISNQRMYHVVKMCYRLNLCCFYYYNNQKEQAKDIYAQSQKIFKPFRKTPMYGGNIAVVNMFMGIIDGNYDAVDEQLRIAKEKWTNPRLQDDYYEIEKILKEHIKEREPIYEEFSKDKKYKFEIYQLSNNNYDVWILYFDEEIEDYFDLNDDRHIVDTLEKGKNIGRSLIANTNN